jgi:GNAT superfamily N-acetyltransferase
MTLAPPSLAGPVTVARAEGRADITSFIRLPYRLYRGDPRWTPPLERDVRAFLSRRHNPFLDFAQVELFLARRNGEVVGRIAAIDDPHLNAAQGVEYGGFGMFEAVDDPAVAAALVDATCAWLRSRGRRILLGPLNFSTNRECGLLIDGFETPPSFLIPYNPPYYPRLLEACGLTKCKDLWNWTTDLRTPDPERIHRLGVRAAQRQQCILRFISPRDLDADAATLRYLYNEAWKDNWGFSPMTEREFRHLLREIKPLLRRGVLAIAETDGQPVGFGMMLPDANPALRAAAGKLWRYGIPLGAIRIARQLRRVTTARALAIGVLQEHRGQGIDVLMRVEALREARARGFLTLESSWTLEDNEPANIGTAALGAVRSSTHRIYQLHL